MLSHGGALQSQKDLGFVLNPGEGPISAVALYVPGGAAAPTHLFSGGVDGTLAVWSAGRSWDCLKVSSGVESGLFFSPRLVVCLSCLGVCFCLNSKMP